MESEEPMDDGPSVPTKLFSRILSCPDVFYKHQQRDDEDLSEEERREILRELYSNNKKLFLQRYVKYMVPSDCANFVDLEDDSCSACLLMQVKKGPAHNLIRNRRFMAMQKLVDKGEYFGDVKMREREPFLFDAMVGRFLDESQRDHLRPSVNRDPNSWAQMISEFEDSCEIADRRNTQEAFYENVPVGSSIERHRSRFMAHVANAMNKDESEDNLDELREEIEQISKEDAEIFGEGADQQQLREEFDAYMRERFLAGRDAMFFNYEDVDRNEGLDDTDEIYARDEEERWFDED